jgi:deazaflavin-dependent oxidoreductase (nitroreductase family)
MFRSTTPKRGVMTKFSQLDFIQKHIALYKSDPEKAHMWDSTPGGGPGILPTLLLTTKGRKTGEPRDVPLIYGKYDGGKDDGRFVVIASRGGTPTHPVWFLNLEADPECEAQVSTQHVKARARVAEGEERERLWRQMVEIYPPYESYQENAGARTIPVVVLEPR